jgi:membrane protein implicated in regulation of membrane protease activity
VRVGEVPNLQMNDHVSMAKRDHDNDPILDVNDVLRWAGIGMLTLIPTLVWLSDAPWWAALLVTLLYVLAARPLHRRYTRRAEARRPHQ